MLRAPTGDVQWLLHGGGLFEAINPTNIGAILLVGLVVGGLASLLFGGGRLLWDLAAGLIGSALGVILLHAFAVDLPIQDPFMADMVVSSLGAVIMVVLARVIA